MKFQVNIKLTTPKGLKLPLEKYNASVEEFLYQLEKQFLTEIQKSESCVQSYEQEYETCVQKVDCQRFLDVCGISCLPTCNNCKGVDNALLQVHSPYPNTQLQKKSYS